MLVFFGLVSKTCPLPPEVLSRVDWLAARHLPFRHMPYGADKWVCPSGRVALFAWDNAPSRTRGQPVLEKRGPNALAVAGYTASKGLRTSADLLRALQSRHEPREVVRSLGGVHAVAYADGPTETLRVWNSYMSLVSVFWSETDEQVAVSNRALLVHLFGQEDGRPRYDIEALASFLAAGQFTDRSTPFRKVEVFPQNTEFRLSPSGHQLLSIDRAEEQVGAGSRAPDDRYYDELTERLLAALEPVKDRGGPVTMGLTGGKDSRPVAAAMARAGIPFSTYTIAEDNHPDATVANVVADILDVPHEIRRPSGGEDSITVDLLRRTVEHLTLCEGMLHMRRFPAPVPRSLEPATHVVGQGGEFLRGGWLKITKNRAGFDEQKLRAILWDQLVRFPELFQGGVLARYEARLDEWVGKETANSSPEGALERIFFWIYGCRWAAPGFMACRCLRNEVYPLCDANFLRKSQEVAPKFRINDDLSYHLVERLEPRLLDVPFHKWRWAFEQDAPRDGDWQAWRKRAPLEPHTTGRESVNWLQEVGGDLKDELEHQIFHCTEAQDLFRIVDRKKLEDLFYSPDVFSSRAARFFFNTYIASVLLSNQWLDDVASLPTRPLVVRCDARWWQVNRRLCRILQRAANSLEAFAVRRLGACFDEIADRADRKFVDRLLRRVKREPDERFLETARAELLARVVLPQLGRGRLTKAANKALETYLRKLVKNLPTVQAKFALPQTAWEAHLDRFPVLSSVAVEGGRPPLTLRGLLTDPSVVHDALCVSEGEMEAQLLRDACPTELFRDVGAGRDALLKRIADHANHLKELYLTFSGTGILAPAHEIHQNVFSSLKLRS